jgi:hypothetical protein
MTEAPPREPKGCPAAFHLNRTRVPDLWGCSCTREDTEVGIEGRLRNRTSCCQKVIRIRMPGLFAATAEGSSIVVALK